jgi:hypothetical protein
MELNFRKQVEQLLNKYKREMTEALSKVKEIEASELYSSDGKAQLIRDIKAELQKGDAAYNKQLNTIILKAKDDVQSATIRKPSDYQNMLNNALNQINMIGDKLTDQVAYDIVKPFFGDYETMHNLHSVVSNMHGKDGLNLTTRTLGWFDGMVKTLDQIESGTKTFFRGGQQMAIGVNYAVGSEMLTGMAEELDQMGKKMDDLTKFKFEEAEESIDESIKEKMFGKDGE